jgi:hypothetical protein
MGFFQHIALGEFSGIQRYRRYCGSLVQWRVFFFVAFIGCDQIRFVVYSVVGHTVGNVKRLNRPIGGKNAEIDPSSSE